MSTYPLYDWSNDQGPDDLSDVEPIPGGVPIRHIPNASRLAQLIGHKGGFDLWAREILGEHEAECSARQRADAITAGHATNDDVVVLADHFTLPELADVTGKPMRSIQTTLRRRGVRAVRVYRERVAA